MRLRPSLTVLVLALAACATNPATGKKEISLMSVDQEIQIGQQSDPEIRRQMGVYENAALQEYVRGIGMRLARVSERPDLPWHFTIVDTPAVNAFAVPGGYIYITRGILPYLDSEAALAGVLGHEVGHVTARHSAQQYTKEAGAGLGLALLSVFVPEAQPFGGLAQQAAGLLFLKYGRDDELQADGLGVRYASRAGWDPHGVQQMLTTLQRLDAASGTSKGVPNWLSTHPAAADRVEKVDTAIRTAAAAAPAGGWTVGHADYLQQIDGIVFGDEPSEGIVRGRSFLHPDLRLAITYPEGWDIQNSREQVLAKAPDKEAYVLLQLVQRPQGSVQQIAQTSMANSGWQQVAGQPATINGLTAYVGTYQGAMQGLGNVATLAAHIGYDQRIFLLAGLAPVNIFRASEPQFQQTIQSFRPLSAAEAAAIRPLRVDLYTVQPGDTWESLSRRSGAAQVKPSTLAIMNASQPSTPPRAGTRIKILVER
jgi:predicted Zn-dependent protease